MTARKFMALAAAPLASALLVTCPSPAAAQAESDTSGARRTRIALGPQIVPSFPGADSVGIRPLVDVARARGDEPFAFEAPDESFGFSVARKGAWQFGPALGFEGQRSRDNTNGLLPKVGFTFELGGFVQYELTSNVRLRTEVRQGIGGHKGLIGTVGADYVIRDADRWLFSVGPRVTGVNGRYSRAYFGIDPATAMTASLPAFGRTAACRRSAWPQAPSASSTTAGGSTVMPSMIGLLRTLAGRQWCAHLGSVTNSRVASR